MRLIVSVDTGLPWGLPLSNIMSVKAEERMEIALSDAEELSKLIEKGLDSELSGEELKVFDQYVILIKTIIIRRLGLPNRKGYGPSAIVGEPDFLPFPFLKIGVERGSAVCRIVRTYSKDSAKLFKAKLKEANIDNPHSLASIFSLVGKARKDFVDEHKQGFSSKKTNYLDDFDIDDFVQHLVKLPIATGFLVGKDFVLTNCHTFSHLYESQASHKIRDFEADFLNLNEPFREYSCQFDYEHSIHGGTIEPIVYEFDKIVVFDKTLDYALVKLKSTPTLRVNSQGTLQSQRADLPKLGSAGEHFGIIPFNERSIVSPPLFPKKKHLNDVQSAPPSQEALSKRDKSLKRLLTKILEEIDESLKNNFTASSEVGVEVARVVGSALAASSRVQSDSTPSKVEISGILYELLKDRADVGEPVNVIQHPRGRRKEVVLSSGRVLETFQDFIMYDADSDFCASGSPVFNQRWDLVALNRSTVPKQTPSGERGQVQSDILDNFEIMAQEGILIRSIIVDMKQKYNEWKDTVGQDTFSPILDELLGFLHSSGNYDSPSPILRNLPPLFYIEKGDPINQILLEGKFNLTQKLTAQGFLGLVDQAMLETERYNTQRNSTIQDISILQPTEELLIAPEIYELSE